MSNAEIAIEQQLVQARAELADTREQLQATQEQLAMQEKLAALGAMTAKIAHEVKNPLNFITNFAISAADLSQELGETLRNNADALDSEVVSEVEEILSLLDQSVKKIEEHCKRANSILDQMLLHVRGERTAREQIDFNQLVGRSIPLGGDAVRRRNAEFDVKLEVDFDPTVGEVQIAVQDLTRVLINIISNAWYALAQKRRALGPAFAPTLRVTTRDVEDQVELVIRDNGPGIPPDVVDRVFEPFFTTKPVGEGTGLGLSIAHDIVVRDHRGTMAIDTAAGEYTQIMITLPKQSRSTLIPRA